MIRDASTHSRDDRACGSQRINDLKMDGKTRHKITAGIDVLRSRYNGNISFLKDYQINYVNNLKFHTIKFKLE